MNRKRAILAAFGVLASVSAHAVGTVVVCGDEWTLSDSAFTGTNSANTKTFATNLANFMIGGSGTILDTSANGVHSGIELDNHLTGLGYTVDKDFSSTFDLALISGYDAIIVGGNRGAANDAGNLAALTAYVNGGGSVYVFGGTGDPGSAVAEAAQWNPFTTLYGITMSDTYTPPASLQDVTTDAGLHPLRNGVDKITFGFGHDLTVSGGSVVAISGGPELEHPIGIVATNVVPEPASLAALSLGLLALRRRRA
ncbi:MAG TPA: PEP-CTERM sorting domain-containing protein [Fimbriimonadaceae bacterium]|nr:PEP-CTERM sorting domain-containing protein [Fimbriimonadaceae bacterium]